MITRTKLLPRTEHVRDCWICVIVTEGTTEGQYFARQQEKGVIPRSRVKVVPVPPESNDSAPSNVCKRADAYLEEHKLNRDLDQLWLVFDVEAKRKTKQLSDAVTHAMSQGYRWAINHPNFEIWLLLHHTEDLSGIVTPDDCERRLRSILGSYNKTDLNIARFPPTAIRTAITRARQVTPDLRGWPTTPGTQVYALLETLLPTSAS